MAGQTHNNLIQINVFRSAQPAPVAGFGTLAILAYDTGLSDNEIAVISSASEAESLLAAGAGRSAALQALGQLAPVPQQVIVIEVAKSVAGPPAIPNLDDYEDALDALVNSGLDFYGVAIADTSANLTQNIRAGVGVKVEALEDVRPLIFFMEDDSTEWIDAIGTAAGGPYETSVGPYLTLLTVERTAVIYHDPATPDYAAVAWAAYRLAFDADAQTALFTGELTGVVADSGITPTQKANAIANNVNLALPFGAAPARVALGVNLRGRQLHQILAGDWLKARINESLQTLILDYDRRGDIIPVSYDGQNIVSASVVQPVLARGQANGKIVGEPRVTFPAITPADLQNFRIPLDVDVQLVTGGVRFRINLYLGT